MTILDACVEVLKYKKQQSIDDLYNDIIKNNLYDFKAKDPKNILRSTIRKHIRSNPKPRITEVKKGIYKLV